MYLYDGGALMPNASKFRSEDHREDRSAGFGGFLRVSVQRNPPITSACFQGVAEVGGFGGFLLGLIIIFINISLSVLTHYYCYSLTAAPKETRKTRKPRTL